MRMIATMLGLCDNDKSYALITLPKSILINDSLHNPKLHFVHTNLRINNYL